MKTLIECDKATIARLAERLKQAGSYAEYQRIQCVLIRATLGSSAGQIVLMPNCNRVLQQVLNECRGQESGHGVSLAMLRRSSCGDWRDANVQSREPC